MTKARLRYEKPALVDLNGESAVGATCSPTGINATGDNCTEGSCPINSICKPG